MPRFASSDVFRRAVALCAMLVLAPNLRAQRPADALQGQVAASPVRVAFAPESASFAAAAKEYTAIWARDGARIVAAMERIAGIRFDAPPYADTAIGAVIIEGVSHSGYRDRPMRLRASYPEATKRATLVHELGHRLQVGVAGAEDEHEVLFLWLYDTWVLLWGKEFADEQVLVERARRGPYPRAWDAVLALSESERAARFAALRDRKEQKP